MKNKLIWKDVGETPLEALERFRSEHPDLKDVPMAYAGRLDPMASGILLILIGDECKKKEEYLNLDKVYEVEICFGIETDSYDGLGIASAIKGVDESVRERFENIIGDLISKAPFSFSQEYPPFSSKAVGGRQLHALARAGELPEKIPSKGITIYSVDLVQESFADARLVIEKIIRDIQKIKGDFRQEEIILRWQELINRNSDKLFIARLKVKCSSGTYMRSLAHRLGKDAGTGAFAVSIVRKEILIPRG